MKSTLPKDIIRGTVETDVQKKALKSNYGEIEVEVPRDRNSEFEPIAVKKRQRSISDFDDKIISMYAKGMTTTDIQAHIQELYGFEMSPALISNYR